MSHKPKFIQFLKDNGCYASVVSVEHLDELGAEIRALHDRGAVDEKFYSEYEKLYFWPKPPKSLPNAKSIIVAAVPQPMLRATFHWRGRTLKFIVPPTYYDNKKTRSFKKLLIESFAPRRYKFVRAVLPIKLLAVRSGLARYGRNNITYTPKSGSLHRLMAYFTDYDSPVDYWQEKQALPLCESCKACLNACPTKAIKKDRFLIHAERCLTYLNEKKSIHEFPDWVGASAHNALIGCMRCQMACPYDKKMIESFEDRGEFTEKETAYLLKGRFSGREAARMQKKLKGLGLELSVFPRNLRVLIALQKK